MHAAQMCRTPRATSAVWGRRHGGGSVGRGAEGERQPVRVAWVEPGVPLEPAIPLLCRVFSLR